METIEFFEKLLGSPKGMESYRSSVHPENHEVHIYIDYQDKHGFCSRTGVWCKVYDKCSEGCWEHLDELQYKTFLHCRLPGVKNSFSEISTIEPPWVDPGERQTHLFEVENKSISVFFATHNRSQTAVLMKTSEEKK